MFTKLTELLALAFAIGAIFALTSTATFADSAGATAPAPLVIEAESGILEGGTQINTDDAASGGAAVGSFHIGGASLTLKNIDGAKGGPYTMVIRYATPNDSSTTLYVNDAKGVVVQFPATPAWFGKDAYKDVAVGITLVAGKTNVIKFKTEDGNGAVNLDKITLTPGAPKK